MFVYFLLIRIAALFGHRKARLLVRGQKAAMAQIAEVRSLQGAVWIHAASVGEFEQARPIIERLRREHPEQKIVLSFFSPSGYEVRKNYEYVDLVTYLPFATRRKARRWLDLLQPRMAIFVKYEFWPAYLRELKRRGIATYSISAIFRPGQLFFLPWGKQHLALLKCFTHIYVQDESSLRLLQEHGIQHTSIAGDTRFDRVREIMASGSQQAANIDRLATVELFAGESKRVIVAGSTWPQDEELFAQYIASHPDVKLILAPHEIHAEHLHRIFQLFQGRFVRLTEATSINIRHTQVLVIDTIGLLSQIYRYGQVAYIGGGFGAGIHNTIEAAVYGMPVTFGPKYQHFREAIGLIDAGAARSVKNYQQLEIALDNALEHYEEIGAKAAAYAASETGASAKIYNEIFGN